MSQAPLEGKKGSCMLTEGIAIVKVSNAETTGVHRQRGCGRERQGAHVTVEGREQWSLKLPGREIVKLKWSTASVAGAGKGKDEC